MIEIEQQHWDAPDAAALRAAQRAELDARYQSEDHEAGEAPTAETVTIFLLARRAGVAVGCGGLRFLGPGEAEIKRMYVEPASRGAGVSTALLRALEEHAAARGIRRLGWKPGSASRRRSGSTSGKAMSPSRDSAPTAQIRWPVVLLGYSIRSNAREPVKPP